MQVSRSRISAAVLAVGVVALAAFFWPEGDDRAIKRRLNELVDEANASAGEGLSKVTRAATLGTFFTGDVVVDLGQGAATISGREMLVGMAARFQPSTTSRGIGLQDVTVAKRQGVPVADVALTVTFTAPGARAREQTIDAREFALEMRKEGGEWLIARATAVDTLK